MKINFYDFWVIFSMGYLILYLFRQELMELQNCGIELIACYIIGLFYHKLSEFIFKFLRNKTCMIERACRKVNNELPEASKIAKADKENYYNAYYSLMAKNMLGNIPALEMQGAFLRNLYLLLFFYVIAVCGCRTGLNIAGIAPCHFVVFLMMCIIAVPFVWYHIQMKIYFLVWEGYAYLNKNNYSKNQ